MPSTKGLEYYKKYPIFGIILFTEADPYVVKVLKDSEYYTALDELSGTHLPIFATMLFSGKYRYPSPRPGTLGMMMPIWEEPVKNKEILSWFKIKDSRALPQFVLFGVSDKELYYQTVHIKSDTTENTFNSLQQILSVVSYTVVSPKDSRKHIKNHINCGHSTV